jgi:hypothetical protein
MVETDIDNDIYNYQCCKFNKDGILCCHVLKVMTYLGTVRRIPEHYLLARWSKSPPDIVVPTAETVQQPVSGTKLSRKDMRMLRYGNLCSDFAKLAVDFASSEKTKEIIEAHMKAMVKDLAAMKKASADASKRRKKGKNVADSDPTGDMATEETADNEAEERAARIAENKLARDPPVTSTKGRPTERRKKSGLQLQKPQKCQTKCAVCNEPGHVANDCPVRLANPDKYPLLSLFQR